MYCKNCGKELNQGDIFCKECGTATNYQAKNKEEYEKPTEKHKPKKKKGKLILIVIACVFALFILMVMFSDDDSSSDSGKENISDTIENNVADDAFSFEEKINLATKNNDFETISALIPDVPEENKSTFTVTVNDAAMKYLCNNLYNILTHNYNFIEEAHKKLSFVENAMFADTDAAKTYALLKKVYADKEIVDKYNDVEDAISGVAEIEGTIVNRVQNADYNANEADEKEYLDQYTVSVNWMDNNYIVLQSSSPLAKGPYYGFGRYIGERTYTSVDDGFEEVRPVYVPLTGEELAAYREAQNNYSELYDKYLPTVDTFNTFADNISVYSEKYSNKLSDSNYTGTYAGGIGADGFTYNNYHKLTLNEDHTFCLVINAGYGFNTYEGSFSKENNTIKCKYYDVIWTFEIRDTELIHTGTTGEMDGMLFENQIFKK